MSKNKRFSVPHFSWAKGFTPKRSEFMSGKWHAYFAPGHKPDVIATTWQNPTDWMKANALLRMPQVVWLECRIHVSDLNTSNASLVNATDEVIDAGGTTNQLWTADGVTHEFVLPGAPGFVPPPPPSSEMQDNRAMVEKDRLMTIFNAVKTKIEAKRPGRTWVQVINWFDSATTGQAGTVPSGFSVDHNGSLTPIMIVPLDHANVEYKSRSSTPSNSWNQCLAGFLESPWASFPPYLGTDFLSVYCGNVFTSGFTDTSNLYLPDLWTPASFIASSYYQDMYDQYKAATPLFFGLSSRLFHPDLAWGGWTIDAPGSVFTDNKFENWTPPGSPSPPGSWADLTNYTSLPFTASGAAHANALCGDNVTFTRDVFDLVKVQALIDKLDITHLGGTSLIADEDYLVKMIASRFHFNPETFKDLPVE